MCVHSCDVFFLCVFFHSYDHVPQYPLVKVLCPLENRMYRKHIGGNIALGLSVRSSVCSPVPLSANFNFVTFIHDTVPVRVMQACLSHDIMAEHPIPSLTYILIHDCMSQVIYCDRFAVFMRRVKLVDKHG